MNVLIVSLGLAAALLAARYARYVRVERGYEREQGDLFPLDVARVIVARNPTRTRRCVYLGRSGEHGFYLTARGPHRSRSLVGRARSRKLFGIARV